VHLHVGIAEAPPFARRDTDVGDVHEDVAHPAIRKMAFDYVTNDVIPSLESSRKPYPLDLAAYRDVVIDRFSNPYLQDTNQRVAMDGYAGMPRLNIADVTPTLFPMLQAAPLLGRAFVEGDEQPRELDRFPLLSAVAATVHVPSFRHAGVASLSRIPAKR
jgi:hypothetical protein